MISRWDPVYLSYLKQTKFTFKFPTQILRKVASSFSGGTPSKEHLEYWNGNIPWASPKDVKEFYLSDTEDYITEKGLCSSSSKLAAPGSVLLVVRSGILQHTIPVSVCSVPMAINQDINENSTYKDAAIPFCLLLFNGASETDKFCRALFHNINTKQIPLKDEENLSVIIESVDVFSDDDLAINFGTPYLYTRKICVRISLSHYPLIKKYIGNSKYTYFVGIFEHLLKEGLIEDKPECVDVIIQKLSDINTALRESGIANVTENIAVLGAMTFYKLQDQAKYRSFIHWVQKNNIGIADKLHINDVISIYDSVYAHTPKRVFLARWYPDSEPHLSKANGRLAVIKRIVEQDFGLQLIDLGTKGGGTYSIRDLMYREIEASDIFIADLTSNRHNVMVEVGYAIKNVGLERMLLYFEPMEGVEKPPFDLNGFRYEQIADSNDIEIKVKPKLKDILDGVAVGEL